MRENDGDIVRGLGYVTLYSAYLEQEVEGLLSLLARIRKNKNDTQRWPISKKIKETTELVRKLEFEEEEKDNLICRLDSCTELFQRRNELIHGRIFATLDGPDILESGRANTPTREIFTGELYDLANELWDMRSRILGTTVVDIRHAMKGLLNEKA